VIIILWALAAGALLAGLLGVIISLAILGFGGFLLFDGIGWPSRLGGLLLAAIGSVAGYVSIEFVVGSLSVFLGPWS
jgi:hypothetical protein